MAAYLIAQRVGVYLIAGDLTNHFAQSLAAVEQLQRLIAPAQVRFIAGNHDMLHDVTYAGLESPLAPTYLHRGYLDVAGTNWQIIGNNGWYDYQFAHNLWGRDFATWKRAFWVDGSIERCNSNRRNWLTSRSYSWHILYHGKRISAIQRMTDFGTWPMPCWGAPAWDAY